MSDPLLTIGSQACKCGACGSYFTSVKAFDMHRKGTVERYCVPPGEVKGRKGQHLLERNEKGQWKRPY